MATVWIFMITSNTHNGNCHFVIWLTAITLPIACDRPRIADLLLNVVNSVMPREKTVHHMLNLLIAGVLIFINFCLPAPLQAAENKPTAIFPCMTATLIVPSNVGSGSDIVARSLVKAINADGKSPSLKVKNIPGRQGQIARTTLRQSAGDGCYLGLFQQRLISAFLTGQDNSNWYASKPVARLTATPLVLVSPASSVLGNLSDLVASLSADGAVRVGIEQGSQNDFLLRMIEQETDGRFIRVNLTKGHQRLAAFKNNAVDLIIVSVAMATRLAKDDGAKILAVSSDMVTGLPSLKTSGLEISFTIERGIHAPIKTKAEMIKLWANRLEAASKTALFAETLGKFETQPRFLAPEPFTLRLEDQTIAWRDLARAGGIYGATE